MATHVQPDAKQVNILDDAHRVQLLSGPPNRETIVTLQQQLLHAISTNTSIQQVLHAKEFGHLLKESRKLLDAEPTLLEIIPSMSQSHVTVVGDTHGQFHDLCQLFELYGYPSADRIYVFNGDYVDRGAWGVETLALLLAWKWALPHNVYLLRGNHEGSFCTKYYGFMTEVAAKYGKEGKSLYKDMVRLFACLPLAALIEGSTLILHGGLFRAPPDKARGQRGAPRTITDLGETTLRLGTLDDLRAASKGGVDPDPEKSLNQLVASDVLWSDPSPSNGLRPNDLRGVGTVFGPDVTQTFLTSNGLRLIIRSHEGPDARQKRAPEEKMASIDTGYAVDHDGPAGRLVTLFSAPDYPQFMTEEEERYHNKAAVITLTAPDYATPEVSSFGPVLPRPQGGPYYDVSEGAEASEDSESLETGHQGKNISSTGLNAAAGGQHVSAAADQQTHMQVAVATEQNSACPAENGCNQPEDSAPVSPTVPAAKRTRTRSSRR